MGRIASRENLLLAYMAARRAGRVRPAATRFEFLREEGLEQLRRELLARTYRPGPYHSFTIHEPKRRVISAAPFRDRIVHHALVRVLEPIFERRFIHDSYACRRRKGTHAAVDRAERMTASRRYVLSTDIVRFFPSVDHAVLLGVLGRVIRCRRTLDLISLILEGGADVLRSEYPGTLFPGDDLLSLLRPRGLPIGNLTSQFFANCFLDPLDHFAKEDLRVRAYVRYADDFRVFHDDPGVLREIRDRMMGFAAGLRLVFHDRKTRIAPCRIGVPFLGFVLFPDGRRRLRREGVRRFRRRLRSLADDLAHGRTTMDRVSASVRSWLAHADHAQTHRLREQILKEVTFRCTPPIPPSS
jgi:retron-type reverse transcriptase